MGYILSSGRSSVALAGASRHKKWPTENLSSRSAMLSATTNYWV
jgi:hypothetical protein